MFLLAGSILVVSPSFAADPPAEVRAVIQRQFDAFAHDDAAGAYAIASPGIQAVFPDADTFITMVRKSYAPVYRHRSAEFGAFTADGDDVEQAVTLVDENNEVWIAIYKLSRQPDGSWKSTGCVMTKSAQSSL
jgi:hypothetical protein